MSLPNTRIVVTGTPRADAEFTIVEVNARETQKLADEIARLADRAKGNILAALRGNTTLTRR